jgi:tetratricopeptide (TPR) repeat protein
MRRVIEIFEASSGPEHPSVAVPLNNLAGLLQDADRPDEAEPLYRRALSIIEASYGPEHPNVASVLNNLASLLQTTERLEEAELLMSRALEIFLLSKMRTGHEHPHVRTTIGNYARLLTEIGFEEAEQRAKIESLIDSVQNRVAD